MASSSSFEKALNRLRLYYDIPAEIDSMDLLVSGKSASQLREALRKKLPNSDLDGKDTISDLFQNVQHAYFAADIVRILKEFKSGTHPGAADTKDLEKSINVICTSTGVGKKSDIKFGEFMNEEFGNLGETQSWPEENALLTCDLNDYTAALKFTKDKETKKWKFLKNENLIEINENVVGAAQKPDKNKPTLSAIVVHSQISLPSNRSTGGAALFLGHIPTLEMSRCIPHLEITILSPHPRLSQDGKKTVNGISLTRFLMGHQSLSKNETAEFFTTAVDDRLRPNFVATASKEIIDQVKGQMNFEDMSSKTSAMGMEAFTSPQTMVNGHEEYSDFKPPSHRTAPILDKFRPFMSIRDFKVDLIANIGLIMNKTASLTLILHDRSRMAEISELIKIDIYGDTEIMVEYGWNHPERFNQNNPWGEFLNSLKILEKFQVTTSSFSFDEVGQVTISLKLALKGQSDNNLTKVANYEANIQGAAALAELLKAIKSFKKMYPSFPQQEKKWKTREPREGARKTVTLWNFHVDDFSDTKSILSLSNKDIKQIKEFIKNNLKGEGDKNELATHLNDFFNSPEKGSPSALDNLKKSIAQIAKDKIESIRRNRIASLALRPDIRGYNHSEHTVQTKAAQMYEKSISQETSDFLTEYGKNVYDPFFHKQLNKITEVRYNAPLNILDYTNFGTLFMNFVARPLAASKKFLEVQVIFYCFNGRASYMRDLPISSFPIKLDDFQAAYLEAGKTGIALRLNEFVNLINQKFVGEVAYRTYGFSHMYKKDPKTKEFNSRKKYDDNSTAFNQDRERVLADAYSRTQDYDKYLKKVKAGTATAKDMPQLTFVQPRLSAHFECLASSTSAEHTILRIQIFDGADTGNDLAEDLMEGTKEDSFTTITRNFASQSRSAKAKFRKALFVTNINELLDKGIITVQGSNKPNEVNEQDFEKPEQLRFEVTSGVETVKKECKSRMASIDYGTANTNVISANVSSNAPAGLFEINLTRANLGTGRSPLGAKEANMPVEFAPITLSIKSMGYPFFYIGQEFFMDFRTGTTVDNIYRVSKVSHQLSEGNFNTSINLIPGSAYGKYKSITNILSDAINLMESTD